MSPLSPPRNRAPAQFNDFMFVQPLHMYMSNGAKLAVASVARATPLFLPCPEIIYINVLHYSAPPRTYLLRATPPLCPDWRQWKLGKILMKKNWFCQNEWIGLVKSPCYFRNFNLNIQAVFLIPICILLMLYILKSQYSKILWFFKILNLHHYKT